MSRDYQSDGYRISTDKSDLNLTLIHQFLTNSYWANGIAFEKVKRAIENSLCFGVYDKNRQIGFARVITDHARVAYLADVFIIETHRGQGLGKWLMEHIMAHPQLQSIDKWLLQTLDAHGLYSKYGFAKMSKPEYFMEWRPDAQK